MARMEFPRKIRRIIIERAAGCCEQCKAKLKTGEGEIDHILPDALGGEPTVANGRLICRVCHAEKTAADIQRIRKADRQRDRANGAIRPAATIKSQGFPKSRQAAERQAKASGKLPLPAARPMFAQIARQS
ncbi:HNH endonuclease [Aminobacter sp. MSH1]|uniref:HNH endonuclease n=1 Tax=Aminobacter sp. MSH1 TaxID=374606 RepID=UPI000D359E3D|nr:HNH endonuclease signature motif containing protein [Aminobacter sp. MSH1]AWC25403.1 HNH endonuclease [Aminobacter sp. MSH1]